MKIIIIAVRILAIVYGSIYATLAVLASFGVGSREADITIQGIVLDISIAILYGTLLLPYKKIRRSRTRLAILVVLLLQAFWCLYLTIHNSIANYETDYRWPIILWLVFLQSIVVANIWAYHVITGKKPEEHLVVP